MKTADFHFDLPEDLIAQHPLPDPLDARLMVLDRAAGTLRHATVRELPLWVRPCDLFVFNDTRVIPARVFGRKPASGGRVEILFLRDLGGGEWNALLRAGSRRPKIGDRVVFGVGDEAGVTLLEDFEKGRCRIRVECARPLLSILEDVGEPPLPPYIRREGKTERTLEEDKRRYQTMFADRPGAVAAPTAGLHFTPALLDAMRAAGASETRVTLHVGPGTFRPVTAEKVTDHEMDPEWYELPETTATALRATRAAGGRIVGVGSTSTRTLETVAARFPDFQGDSGDSRLFIYPPYPFRAVDAIFTNFHLPCSTLLMMMSAFAGRERMLEAYAEAVRERYRFFSYGDAMLVV